MPSQVGSMEHQLLSSKLQRCYGSVSQAGGDAGLQLYCPALLQPCVARYHDNLWYRARITGQSPPSLVPGVYVCALVLCVGIYDVGRIVC